MPPRAPPSPPRGAREGARCDVGEYVARRLLSAVGVALAVSVLAFFLIHLSGDPIALLAPLDARPEDIENLRRQFGLDQPLAVQLGRFLLGLLQGDVGESFQYRQPAFGLVLERFGATAQLALVSLILPLAVGIPLGITAARHAGGFWAYVSEGLLFLAISTPAFWLGLLLILIFADGLGWLPASGRGSVAHMVMPALTLSAYSVGLVGRVVRSAVLDVMKEPYVMVARSKGLEEGRVFYKHALRNALVPTVTVLGLQMGAFLGGSVIVETVFAWPGIGWLMYQGISHRDLPLVRAVTLVVGLAFALINLLVDVLYVFIDPRIRYD